MSNSETAKTLARLPNVLLIGAQKAGTSAIADWLFQEGGFQRPHVFDEEPHYYSKEVHFFDIDHRYYRGVDFYAERFPQDGTVTMDATPDTLAFAERVQSTYIAAGGNQLHAVKIIVILREPVSRELSLYNHLVFDCKHLDLKERSEWSNQAINKQDGSIMSFDDFVQQVSIPALVREDGPGRSSRHGLYAKHLRKWFECFDRRQILVLSYDELEKDPNTVQGRIESFLERQIPGNLQRSNSNDHSDKVSHPSEEAKKALLDVLKAENERLYQLLESQPGPTMEQKPFPRFFLM